MSDFSRMIKQNYAKSVGKGSSNTAASYPIEKNVNVNKIKKRFAKNNYTEPEYTISKHTATVPKKDNSAQNAANIAALNEQVYGTANPNAIDRAKTKDILSAAKDNTFVNSIPGINAYSSKPTEDTLSPRADKVLEESEKYVTNRYNNKINMEKLNEQVYGKENPTLWDIANQTALDNDVKENDYVSDIAGSNAFSNDYKKQINYSAAKQNRLAKNDVLTEYTTDDILKRAEQIKSLAYKTEWDEADKVEADAIVKAYVKDYSLRKPGETDQQYIERTENGDLAIALKVINNRNAGPIGAGLLGALGTVFNPIEGVADSVRKNVNGEYYDPTAHNAYRFQKQAIESEHPLATFAGKTVGSVGLMSGIGAAAGAGAAAIGSGVGKIGQTALNLGASALTFGATEAYENVGDLAQGELTGSQYARKVAGSTAGGAVAGALRLATAAGLPKILSKLKLQDKFMQFVNTVAPATVAAAGRTGVGYAIEDKKPTEAYIKNYKTINPNATQAEIEKAYQNQLMKNAAMQFAVAFGFSLIQGALNYSKVTGPDGETKDVFLEAKNKLEQLEKDTIVAMGQARQNIEANPTTDGSIDMNSMEQLLKRATEIRSGIASNYYPGQQQKVDDLLNGLDTFILELKEIVAVDGGTFTDSDASAPTGFTEATDVTPGPTTTEFEAMSSPGGPTAAAQYAAELYGIPIGDMAAMNVPSISEYAGEAVPNVSSQAEVIVAPTMDSTGAQLTENQQSKLTNTAIVDDSGNAINDQIVRADAQEAAQPIEASQPKNVTANAVEAPQLTSIENRAKQFPAEIGKVYVDNYTGTDIVDYDENMKKAYNAGKNGESLASLGMDNAFNTFYNGNSNAVNAIYEAGRAAYLNPQPKSADVIVNAANEKKYAERRAKIRAAAEDYEGETARKFIDLYDPKQSPGVYEAGFYTAYKAGADRVPMDEIESPAYNQLTDEQKKAAYDEGYSSNLTIAQKGEIYGGEESKERGINGESQNGFIAATNGRNSEGGKGNDGAGAHVRQRIVQIEGQLKLNFDNQNDEQRSMSAAALADLELIESANGKVKTTGNALTLTEELLSKEKISLVGHSANSAAEIAQLAQVYRDPRFETMRYFFVDKEGNIVFQTGISSSLPSVSAVADTTIPENIWASRLCKKAKSLGASGVWLLHNHPCGDTTPSGEEYDIGVTKALFNRFEYEGVECKGHVVIDHNEYSVISVADYKRTGSVTWVKKKINLGEDTLSKINVASVQNGLLGENIGSDEKLAQIAKRVQVSVNQAVLLYSDTNHKTLLIQECDNSFVTGDQFSKHIANMTRTFGANNAFIITSDAETYQHTIRRFGQNGIRRVILVDPQSGSIQYNSGDLYSGSDTSTAIAAITGDRIGTEDMVVYSNDAAVQKDINESMTMDTASKMIQRAFVIGDIRDWFDGKYKTGDEWLKGEGSDSVALVIDNDPTLYNMFLIKIPGLMNDEFVTADILDAYLNNALTGKTKSPVQKADLSQNVAVADKRFYSPRKIENAKELYSVANQRVTKTNSAEVMQARADILMYAHNKGAAETLGVTPAELNKKLRSWSNYSAKAKEISQRINNGVADSNKWTGIENVSYVNQATVTKGDVERLVKEVKGSGSEWQYRYLARTMLGLDTHIDWSWLSIEFTGKSNGNCRGDYNNDRIRIYSGGANTVAHEMGHGLDEHWAKDLGLNGYLTDYSYQAHKLTGDKKAFYDRFHGFLDSILDSRSIFNEYSGRPMETFARFVAQFVGWTESIATGNRHNYEENFYHDRFTTAQYVDFAKLLQEKAMLDAKGITKSDTISEEARSNEKLFDIAPSQMQALENIRKANMHIRAINDVFDATVAEANGKEVSSEEAQKAISSAVRTYHSTADKAELTDALQSVYDYLSASSKADAREVYAIVNSIASDIIDSAQTKMSEMDEMYPGLRKQLSSTKIAVNDTIKSSIPDWNDFRKQNFGTLKLTTKGNGREVDSVYEELSEEYPNLFPAEVVKDTDRLQTMAEVAWLLKPQMVDGIIYDGGALTNEELDAEKAVLTQKLMDHFFGRQNVSDKSKQYEKQIQALRQQHEKDVESLEETKEWYKNAYKEWKDKTRSWYIDAYKDWKSNRIENEKIRRGEREEREKLFKDLRKLEKMKGDEHFTTAKTLLLKNVWTMNKGISQQTIDDLTKFEEEALLRMGTDPDYALLQGVQAMKVIDRLHKLSVGEMTMGQVREYAEAVSYLLNYQQTKNTTLKLEKGKDIFETAKDISDQLARQKSFSAKQGLAYLLKKYEVYSRNMGRALPMLDNYQRNGFFTKLSEQIKEAHVKQKQIDMLGHKQVEKFTNDNKYMKRLGNETFILKNSEGKQVEITGDMLVELSLMVKDYDIRRSMASGGYVVPNLTEFQKARSKEQIEAAYAHGTTIKVKPSDINEALAQMNDTDKELAGILFDYYNGGSRALVNSKDLMNEVSMLREGFERAKNVDYYPKKVSGDFVHQDVGFQPDPRLPYAGFTKDRNENNLPVRASGAMRTYSQSLNQIQRYNAWTVLLDDYNKIMNTQFGYNRRTVRNAVNNTLGDIGSLYLNRLMDDIQKGYREGLSDIFDKITGNYVKSSFGANLRIIGAQTTSYPMALTKLHADSLAKGWITSNKKLDLDYIDSITPLYYERRAGSMGTELGDVYKGQEFSVGAKIGRFTDWLTKGITKADVWTTGHIALAVEAELKKYYPDLEKGTKAYDKKYAELLNSVYMETQPSFGVVNQSEYQKRKGVGYWILGAFKTASLNMGGNVTDAFQRWKAHKEYSNDKTVNEDDRKWYSEQAKNDFKVFKTAVIAFFTCQALYTAFRTAYDIAMHKAKNYRNEEGEITAATVGLQYAKDLGLNLLTGFYGGGFIGDLAKTWTNALANGNEQFYDIEAPGLNLVNDMIEQVTNTLNAVSKGDNIGKAFVRLSKSVSKILGIPADNFLTYANAVKGYIDDIKNGELFSAGKTVFGLQDNSITKQQYVNRAIRDIQLGDTEAAQKWIEKAKTDSDDISSQIKSALQVSKADEASMKIIGMDISDEAKMLLIKEVNKSFYDELIEDKITASEYNTYVLNNSDPKLSDVQDQGYVSFDNLKEAIGSPKGNGTWHHIVEKDNLAEFDDTQINNINNVVSVSKDVHDMITAHYNTKRSDGRTVREWLSTKSFEEQWKYGTDLLRQYGSMVPTSDGWQFVADKQKIDELIPRIEGTKKAETPANIVQNDIKDSEVKGDDRYEFVVDKVINGEYTAQDVEEWFLSDDDRAESVHYKDWKDAKGDTWSYVKSISDINKIRDKYSKDKDSGKSYTRQQAAVANYLKNLPQSKRDILWAAQGWKVGTKAYNDLF